MKKGFLNSSYVCFQIFWIVACLWRRILMFWFLVFMDYVVPLDSIFEFLAGHPNKSTTLITDQSLDRYSLIYFWISKKVFISDLANHHCTESSVNVFSGDSDLKWFLTFRLIKNFICSLARNPSCTYLLKENPAAVYAKNMSIGGPIIDFNDGLKNVNEGSLRVSH